MAKVQISWQDNSDNEDSFKVYKGSASPVVDTDTLIATVALSGGAWGVTGAGTNLAITSSNTADSVTTSEIFVITYDETAVGDYYYGVVASNAVGDSAVITSSTSVNIS